MDYVSNETQELIVQLEMSNTDFSKEALIKNCLIRKSLNIGMRAFLTEFTNQFEGNEKLKMLSLCRKILIQTPERVLDFDADFIRTFQMEIDLERNNDISVDGISWIDEELRYLDVIKSLTQVDKFANQKSEVMIKSNEGIDTKEVAADIIRRKLITQEEALKIYKTSEATFYRWRSKGLPFYKPGKTVYIDKERADEWVATHEPKKISFIRNRTKSKIK